MRCAGQQAGWPRPAIRSPAAPPTTDASGCIAAGAEPVAFGEGTIPVSVPEGFPVPDGAVVGQTMVDRANHRTQFAFTAPQDATAAVQFYTVNLVSAGFVVTRSQGDPLGTWVIEFSRDGLLGNVVIRSGGPGVAALAAEFNTC